MVVRTVVRLFGQRVSSAGPFGVVLVCCIGASGAGLSGGSRCRDDLVLCVYWLRPNSRFESLEGFRGGAAGGSKSRHRVFTAWCTLNKFRRISDRCSFAYV